jgi:putative transposon-encoded protein
MFKYISIYILWMRKIIMQEKKFHLTDDINFVYEKTITKYGTGAKIDAPKEFLGKKVYVLIRKE